MPVIDVCWVGELPAGPGALAPLLANAAGDALGLPPGRVWVRFQHLPADHYAENGGPLHGALPLFVRVLHARPPTGAALRAEIAELTTALARAAGRPVERVHLEYAPAGAGRMAFGGRLVD